MPELIVEKSIEINASASRIWKVLTAPDLTREWIKEWWSGFIILESDWEEGGAMHWKAADGEIEGKIMSFEPNELVRYSFTMPQDIVTLTLDEREGRTLLSVTHGDFAEKPDGEECYQGALAGWGMSLPKIRELAEK
jgi:uncharacterized protein YndB with AHSA1/START domain